MRSAGGRAQGPGEFQSIEGLYRCAADTVVVQDGRQLEVFGPDGRHGRVVQVIPPPSGGFVRILGVFGDCARLAISAEPYTPFTQTAGLVEGVRGLWWVGPDGVMLDSVTAIPTKRLAARPPLNAEGRLWLSQVPWDGAPALVVSGDQLFVGFPDRFEILVYDRAGALRKILRTPGTREPISRAERAEYDRRFDQWVAEYPADRNRTVRVLDSELPPERPAFRSLLVAEDGSIWLRELAFHDAGWPEMFPPGPGAPPVVWYVLGQGGGWLGQLRLPARLTVHAITSNTVYGVFRDEEDVEQVRRYRFQRR